MDRRKIRDVTIVSLSRGLLGEPFIRHELELGVKRLEAMGLTVRFSNHALAGMAELAAHPEYRALDLLEAFESETDMILCAVGGDDTYRLLPYLFENDRLKNVVSDKVFLGFSDTTMNHLMLHKVGLPTFYGQAFLPDVCELDDDMLPYTKAAFEELVETGTIARVVPSPVWYDSRSDFSPASMGTAMPSHPNAGFELLQGRPQFEGKILGGCIDTLFDIFDNGRYADSARVCEKYSLFPTLDDWRGRILLLESSEEKASPEKYRRMLTALREYGLFRVIAGVLVGKPADETWFAEYKLLLREIIDDPLLPVVVNVNVGHATPRCILPFGVHAKVDVRRQEIIFDS